MIRGQADDGIDVMGVLVPACNEQDDLPDCLAALQVARARVEARGVRVRVVVALDRCTDASLSVVAAAPGVEGIVVSAGNAGASRAAAANHLLRDLGAPARAWLASTDADSLVAADWLVTMRELALDGADVVAGTVVPDARLEPGLMAAWTLQHDLADGHPHVHGANLGIRADVYRRLGGFRPVPHSEDVDLVRRAMLDHDVRIVRTGRIPVRTSHRLVGRAEHGFAGYLRGLAAQRSEAVG